MTTKKNYGFSTNSIHRGEEPDFSEGSSGEVTVPIHLSSTFARREVDKPTGGYEYSRTLNPTRKALEEKLASLENAKYGLAFSSGLAAQSTLLLSLLKSGDHVVAFDDLYGGAKRLFNNVFSRFDIKTSYVNLVKTDSLISNIKNNTKLIWLESPTNPLLKLCDIAAVSKIAHENNILVVVDNTFLSPYFQNPLELGADIVIHSSTKYLAGHSDVVSGSIMLSDETLYEKIKYNQNAIGAIASPFDSYLVLRGIKTLSVRMEKHQENAIHIANYLEKHPKVKRVSYPGLNSHPQHLLAKHQAKGYGGMITFELNGDIQTARQFLENLKLISVAESLGGVESLIEQPAVMTHSSLTQSAREKIGITDTLIRFSVGIEDVDDLIDDLQQSFNKVNS